MRPQLNSLLIRAAKLKDEVQLTGQNLGILFNSRSGCMSAMHLLRSEAIRPNLKLKAEPKQLGSLVLNTSLPAMCLLQLVVLTYGLMPPLDQFRLLKSFKSIWKRKLNNFMKNHIFYFNLKTLIRHLCSCLQLPQIPN